MAVIERVKDLFKLPAAIQRIQFVETLADAVKDPQGTADKYVVTPALGEAFDKALALVGSALRHHRSQAAYVHGSFGSGKSHFMALLSLLLDGQEDAWRIPELHALRPKHEFVDGKKLLQLHLHLIGAQSLEAAIFGKYLERMRALHPEAPTAGLFADEDLFADARRSLDELGDEVFFAPMNEGAPRSGGFGKFSSGTWNRERFERCAASSMPKEREELFSALTRTRYKAFATESRRFQDMDAGLAALSRHAGALGYDGVVLFLDELILWLIGRVADTAWFHGEVQKVVKLVEMQESRREVPIVSFIARQRDLADMVGDDFAGDEHARIRESLKWSEERFDKVRLEDRNLPAIVERRVLRTVDADATRTLDAAFDRLRTKLGPAWQTLLGQLDAKEFRKLYPFSPALVEALVALSNSLQRERTAIRLLMELLVEHAEDLALGDLMAAGDLYDVLAGGGDTADGVMKSRFESAKQLYLFQFLPLIQKAHDTTSADKCQRLRPEHPARLGCSNCPNRACRTDNRLVKTLIIAALVPEVPALREMTARRLVELNHGTLRTPIPGEEASLAAQKLRTWAATIGQLHVGDQANPSVRLELTGVDLAHILKDARGEDSPGARQRVLRDLLFDALGISRVADTGKEHKLEWRGTDRTGDIRFGNIRKMNRDALRCPEDHDFRLIVDYPFDDAPFGPREDEEVIAEFKKSAEGTWTLIWLPSFFSHDVNQMLGELVILEAILESDDRARKHVSHLTVESQARALNDLHNLRSQKRSHIRQVLERAYGLAKSEDGIDPAARVEQHLHVLRAGAEVRPELAANLSTAVDLYLDALLKARYPRHPRFERKLTPKRVDDLVDRFGQIVDADEKRIPADKALGEELRGTLGELGLLRVNEAGAHLVEDKVLQELEKQRQKRSADRPEVAEVRAWIEEVQPGMGLLRSAQDLVVRCYARWSARTFTQLGKPLEVRGGKELPEQAVLEKPDLPSQKNWSAGLTTANGVLGVPLAGRALHADNLSRFGADLEKRLGEFQKAALTLPAALRRRLDELGVPADADRMQTATSGASLCEQLRPLSAKEQVEVLAAFEPRTSARAVLASLGSAERTRAVLEDDLVWSHILQLIGRRSDLPGAEELLGQVAAVLRQDEINVPLAEKIRALAGEASVLLRPKEPKGRVVYQTSLHKSGKKEAIEHLRAALAKIETELVDEKGEVTMFGDLRIEVGERKK